MKVSLFINFVYCYMLISYQGERSVSLHRVLLMRKVLWIFTKEKIFIGHDILMWTRSNCWHLRPVCACDSILLVVTNNYVCEISRVDTGTTTGGTHSSHLINLESGGRGLQKSCLIWFEVLLAINWQTEEFELFDSFTITFYLQSKSNKSTHMGFVSLQTKISFV